MSAASILAEVDRLGVELEARGDKLLYRSPVPMPLRLLSELKAHKLELLCVLRRQRQISAAASPRPIFEYRLAASPALRLFYLGRPGDTCATVMAAITVARHGLALDVQPWNPQPRIAETNKRRKAK